MYSSPMYYPPTYMPQMSVTQPQQLPAAQPQQDTATINWVQGEAAAKAFIVRPGSSVILMDSERDFFYMKAVDQSGMPNFRVFEYKEVTNQPAMPAGDFVARAEFDELKAKINELMNQKGAEE